VVGFSYCSAEFLLFLVGNFMGNLSLRLLNGFEAFLGDQPLTAFESNRVRALLAYLAVENNRAHRREKLVTLLWPEVTEKRARQNLSQALYSLRALLGDRDAEIPIINANPQQIQLCDSDQCQVDVLEFQRFFQTYEKHSHRRVEICAQCAIQLEEAIKLYQGCFLEGFSIPDSKSFEEWIILKREQLQRQAEIVLRTLANHHAARGEYSRAIQYVSQEIELEPWHESAHRRLMQFLALDGQRGAALAQCQVCRRVLAEELDIEPQPETTELFELIRDGKIIPIPFPLPSHNLPVQLTSFVGRLDELIELDEMLIAPEIRLITIVGPGGIGKTRLAIACAQRQLERVPGNDDHDPFSDGVCFVPLTGIYVADQISTEIAKSLHLTVLSSGMTGNTGSTIDQQLFDFLRRKRMLLILDNFEQLLDGAHMVKKIIQNAPDVRILITSRQRLKMLGEQVFRISGLTYPPLEADEDPYRYTAIQLFLNSARRLQPSFEINQENLNYLVEICSMLGGMPLGIELAASWVTLLSLKEIAGEIRRNIGFLESDWEDLPKRHHSLLAVCDTTWRLMSPSEQNIFAQLSIFRGGFTLGAAQEVAKASPRDLQALMSKSILDYDQVNGRYRIHPYLRQYGNRQLSADPEGVFQTCEAHSTFFCAELKKQNDIYESGLPHVAVEQVEKEYANIKKAWDWAVAQGNLESIDQGITGLCHFLLWGMRFPEALTICTLASDKLASLYKPSSQSAKQTKDNFILERVHAKVINYRGYFSTFFDEDQAAQLYEESLNKFNKLEYAGYDVRLEKAQVLILKGGRGAGAWHDIEPQTSKALLLESIALLEGTEHYWWILFSLNRLGGLCYRSGAYQEGKSWLEQGYGVAKKHQIQSQEISFLIELGEVSRVRGNFDAAIKYYQEALSLAISYHMRSSVIGILEMWGYLSLLLGRLGEAVEYSQQAIAIAEEEFGVQIAVGSLKNLCAAQWLSGDFDGAEETILHGVDFTQEPSRGVVVYPNTFFIELLTLTGRYTESAKKIEWVNECLDVSGWPYVSGRLSHIQGYLALVDYRYGEASVHFQASIDCLPYEVLFIAWSQAGMAGAEFGLGHRDEAKKLLNEALTTSMNTQGYVPMVFALPMTLLILVNEDPELATFVYQQVKRDPFLAKAQLFDDLVYKSLPEEITSLPEVEISGGPERREALWVTAKMILEKWTNGG
jgi:predicted ATPase/DNA-binding SARP family transcriptional activator